jgi:hypothetical protein
MKKILIRYILLVLVATLSSGCKSTGASDQHINLERTRLFIEREDRSITNANHEQWDADILRALNNAEFLLKQK